MIEFKALAMKANTDKLHVIFLLKKNVWPNITKTILGYPPTTALEILKEWKMVITSVRQEYESTERRHDYKIETGITYSGQELLMDIGKLKDNFKNGKPKCFNYEIYRHIAKNCQKSKKEKDNRKYYKCKWVGHIAKDCKTELKMKKQSVQEDTNIDTDTEEKDKKKGFGEDPK